MENVENGNGITVSDLHIGQWGTTGKRAIQAINVKIDALKPSLIVLNGDIVEGQDAYGNTQAVHRIIDDGIDAVRTLIQHAVAANPKCKIVYTFGNHDTFREIRTKLEALQKEQGIDGHLQLEESMFRCRDTIFLHGDLQVKQSSKWEILAGKYNRKPYLSPGRAFERPETGGVSGWKDICPHTGVKGFIHQSVVAGISVWDQELSTVFAPVEQYAKSIIACLKEHDPQLLHGVKRIMMGHIHAPYATTYQHEDGMDFLVTGPATAKSHISMYHFTINDHSLDDFQLFSDRKRDRNPAVGK